MKKLLLFFIFIGLPIIVPMTAYADVGPKPSIRIEFTGLEDTLYYGTLLSDRRSVGPASAWDGTSGADRDEWNDADRTIWRKFVEYEDADGFYFLQEWWDCSENHKLEWTYYPPSPFKILLYFPEKDIFYVSPIYERYAFDSYFTVDLSMYETNSLLIAEKSYDFTWELVSLFARIFLTILIELAIAWGFGYREKKLLCFFGMVNVFTQVAFNVLLNGVNYYVGPMAFLIAYILLEFIVFFIEAFLYALLISRYSAAPQKRSKAVLYALAANAGSFMAGLYLAHRIPGIF